MSDSNKPLNWKRVFWVGVIATVTPGGFVLLGMYGIKKFLDARKNKDVPTERSEERVVSDS